MTAAGSRREPFMTNERFMELAAESYSALGCNSVALQGEPASLRVLDAPLIGFASADDPIFRRFLDPEAIGSEFRVPADWMPGARSVAAFFFPFSKEIRDRVRAETQTSSPSWNAAYGGNFRIVDAFLDILVPKLAAEGAAVFQPNRDPSMQRIPVPVRGGEDVHFSVSWSNRHAIFAAGLGTFGMHRHIITEKGCCGTTASFITDAEFTPTPRTYDGVYEWCSRCGACSGRCPGGAIPEGGLRNLKKCSAHGAAVREAYGGFCGKCLTGIPCEDSAPARS